MKSRRSPFQRFMAELRRRHVPQTVAVYVVAGWAAIEFADVVVPNLGWPQGVVTAVIIAAAVGLPVVVALAWFLEWTSEGVHRTPSAPAESAATEPAGARPVEPGGSYTPWAVALGVLSLGIAGALVVIALGSRGDDPTAAADDGLRTRSERRRGMGDSLVPPIPPALVRPGWTEALGQEITGSLMRELELEGLESGNLDALVESARRIGEAAGRFAAGGPLEIVEPQTWTFGAPQPVHPGDTLLIRGIARAEQGVEAVEVNGRVVARVDGDSAELPFRTTMIVPGGSGFRRVPVVIHVAGGDPLRREFGLTLVPRPPAPDTSGR